MFSEGKGKGTDVLYHLTRLLLWELEGQETDPWSANERVDLQQLQHFESKVGVV